MADPSLRRPPHSPRHSNFAVVLAAAILFLLANLVPQVVDLMMMPPPLSGRA